MPEGDTIHRSAARLRPALEGRRLVRFDAPRARSRTGGPRPGATVVSVEARGKHLLVGFDDGHVLHTHMGMTGSWHLYAPGERWRKPPWLARAVVEVEGAVAVCFSAPTVELLHERDPTPHRSLDGLGPDLCVADPDLDGAVARMAQVPDPGTAIADVLLDQRVASGIGNVYKSEALFACGVDPFLPVERVDEPSRRRLLDTASHMLRANLGSGPRTTIAGGLAVYGRARRPCRRCGTPIRTARQGPMARSTYWCPRCQGGTHPNSG